MSLTSQIITVDFPDFDKVEALNNEAFPEATCPMGNGACHSLYGSDIYW